MIAARPEQDLRPSSACAWPNDDHEHAGEGGERPDDRSRGPIVSSRNSAASSSAISGAMKVSAIAWASGTRPMPQKNRNGHDRHDDTARDVDERASCGSAMLRARRGKCGSR